jgi:hypothetical protein
MVEGTIKNDKTINIEKQAESEVSATRNVRHFEIENRLRKRVY